ncbi:hypothetical protein ACFSJ3_02165 [Corallincola platygyrae]|uniref:Uncharacterized protein n=1 Tax=Corallincola platygyrae TaxID=1193278 RepID=A0ABW4XI76_9GAMM
MTLHFTLASHPKLKSFRPSERLLIFAKAYLDVKGWSKLAVNIYKLLLLIPPFIWLANIDIWWEAVPVVMAIPLYPLLTRPAQMLAVEPFLEDAIQDHKISKAKVQ